MSIKISLNKTKKFFIKLPESLGEHAFAAFLVLFIISIIIGALIFYKYSVLAGGREIEIIEKAFQFKEKNYQEILKIWEEREKKFQEAGLKNFLNPFQGMGTKVPSTPSVEQEQELKPEIPLENLQTAINLYKFYLSKGEILPSIAERASLWEELGLGKASEYQGTIYQNQKLLEELKKIFSSMP